MNIHPSLRTAAPASASTEPPAPSSGAYTESDESETRIILLHGEVNDGSALRACIRLLQLDNDACGEPIDFYINSPGGSVLAGLMIIDAMRHVSSPVYTYALGCAASMGAVILAAGSKGHRYVLPHTRVMLHQASGHTGGTLENLRATLKFQNELEDEIYQVLSESTGRSRRELKVATRIDNWLKARDAVAFGLADQVLSKAEGK